jgi:transcriptional regulator with XRE-family HTH domain
MPESNLIASNPSLNSTLQNPAVIIDAPIVREVVRCGGCMLVQFRTVSDLCRRCHRPLPRPLSEMVNSDIETNLEDSEPAAMPSTRAIEPLDVRGKTLPGFALGARLRELRECKNLTQADIARKARVPRTYVSRIEHCHLLPGLGVVERLAEALEVEVTELLPNGSAGRTSSPPNDPYWNALVRHFRLLADDQRAEILQRVRTMIQPQVVSVA